MSEDGSNAAHEKTMVNQSFNDEIAMMKELHEVKQEKKILDTNYALAQTKIGQLQEKLNQEIKKNEALYNIKQDYQDISRRASILSAENIQLNDELSRLKNHVASAADNKLGIFNVDAFRVEQMQSKVQKLQNDYKAQMESAIAYQREMMNEMERLREENDALKKELEGYSITGLSLSPKSDQKRNFLRSTRQYSNNRHLELIKKYKTEICELTKKLSYAESKLETTIKHRTKQYKRMLIEKEKELLRLKKQISTQENADSKKTRVIYSQLASLLSSTDKRNPENNHDLKLKTLKKQNEVQENEITQLKSQLNHAMKLLKDNEENYTFHLRQMAAEHEELEAELENSKTSSMVEGQHKVVM